MAIGPIEIQGSISRTMDFTSIKHQEDNKGQVEQGNLSQNLQKTVENKANSVNRGDDVAKQNDRHDASEKGKNEYNGDGGQNRNKNKNNHVMDKVVVKGGYQSFDIKI